MARILPICKSDDKRNAKIIGPSQYCQLLVKFSRGVFLINQVLYIHILMKIRCCPNIRQVFVPKIRL
jgi:hypothetical protein